MRLLAIATLYFLQYVDESIAFATKSLKAKQRLRFSVRYCAVTGYDTARGFAADIRTQWHTPCITTHSPQDINTSS